MSDLIERVYSASRFPTNTCPASRHAAGIGVALVRGEPYPMLTEKPDHCGESILSAVASLWEARAEIERLTAERDELRRQLAEAELDAERYRWLAGHCRTSIEHWGGRWSIIVDGPVPKAHDSENAFDAAIDAAMGSNMTDALKEPRDQR